MIDVEALRGVHWQYGFNTSNGFKKRADDVPSPQQNRGASEQRASQLQDMARVCEAQRGSTVQLVLGGLRAPRPTPHSESASRYQHMQAAGAQVVGKSHRAIAQESLASRPNRYHQLQVKRAGVDWQTEQSKFDCKDMQDRATLCRAALQSNIPFGVGATCQAGAIVEPSPGKIVLQKAASESAMQRATIAEREMNRGANEGHSDILTNDGGARAQKLSQSQWRTCQAAASEQNISAKYNCMKPADCKAMQGVGAGDSGGVRSSNLYWGNDTEDLSVERESCCYGRFPTRSRNADSASTAFAGARAPGTYRWTPHLGMGRS